MKKLYPTVIIAGLAALAAVATWHPVATTLSPDLASATLEERAWVDAVPRSGKDKFNLYMFSNKRQGLFDRSESSYRHHLELYFFRINGNTIKFQFPHDGRKVDSQFSIERLSRPVNGMDLKLELKNDPMRDGAQVYFGSSEDRSSGLPLDALMEGSGTP